MLFRRRNKKNIVYLVSNYIWPRSGFRRAIKYTRLRVLRLQGSPYSVAAGFACGVAVSFTPLLGFHFVGAALLAWLIGGNFIASAIGTAIGNPWTFPLIWFWILKLGRWIIGYSENSILDVEITNTSIIGNFNDIFIPMMVGGMILGTASWFLSYYPMKYVIVSYRAARRMRLKRKKPKNRYDRSKNRFDR